MSLKIGVCEFKPFFIQKNAGRLMRTSFSITAILIPVFLVTSNVLGIDTTQSNEGLKFDFATMEEGRVVLMSRDAFIDQMSPFDRKVRLQSETDLGAETLLELAAGQVLEWDPSEKQILNRAVDILRPELAKLGIRWKLPVKLIKTTGREESNAAYTRARAIIFPRQKIGSKQNPPVRLLAHELFHVLSRSDPQLRDRLYRLIGFLPTGAIQLPNQLRDRQLTNPDAPKMEHVIRLKTQEGKSIYVTPYLFASRAYSSNDSSLFSYLNFQLLQVSKRESGVWEPVFNGDRANLISPVHPDFRRQIRNNTNYIIHPEEIIADNFAMMVVGSEVKDSDLIDKIRSEISSIYAD